MRKKILIVMLVAAVTLLGILGVQPLSLAQNDSTPEYTYGWRARIFDVPENFNITHSLPSTELGTFVADKSVYQRGEYTSRLQGAPKLDYVLWVGEAILQAEEEGYYVFSILDGNGALNPCGNRTRKAINVEGVNLVAGNDVPLMGADYLAPGLYNIEFRIAGNAIDSSYNSCAKTTFDLRIKRPSDDRGLPISKVLLRPVQQVKKK